MWISDATRFINRSYRRRKSASFLPKGWLLLTVLLLTLWGTMVQAGPIEDLAKEADVAYRTGDFARAVVSYERVLASGYVSGPLLYNLGNAHFKSGHLAKAILAWERAQRIMPHNHDIRYNLELARARTVDRIDPPPRLAIWKVIDAVRDLFAPRTLTTASLLLAILAALAIAVKVVISNHLLRRILTISSTVSAGLMVLILILIGLRIANDHRTPEAIIMVDKVSVMSAPDYSSLEVFALHAGTKVTIVKELEGWREVRLEDGRQGWMPRNACESIRTIESLPGG